MRGGPPPPTNRRGEGPAFPPAPLPYFRHVPPPPPRGETASSSPQAPVLFFGQVPLELLGAGRARPPPHRLSVGVDPLVETLEVVEVGRVQPLDQFRGDLVELPDLGHGAGQQQ